MQIILFRMRTGHNRLVAHMYSRFKVGEFEMCLCNADIITAEHLLQHYQLHDALRQDVWPEPKPEGQALWQPGGAKEDSRFREGNGHPCLAFEDEEEIANALSFCCCKLGNCFTRVSVRVRERVRKRKNKGNTKPVKVGERNSTKRKKRERVTKTEQQRKKCRLRQGEGEREREREREGQTDRQTDRQTERERERDRDRDRETDRKAGRQTEQQR